ncbi:AAA family ATPase [Microbacterium suwonense]|uniref:ATPase AAA-type core domain-containing protein n=1 Tax=Microbacterium suwonense TaxID=683047 RepID=A0ABN6X8P9_9MICO|nr:AAA family ATPase [Microbacterium suwonense]BDZ39766.1 hypothetical protein GCM10025863_23800 [Microbacterium suwonense]
MPDPIGTAPESSNPDAPLSNVQYGADWVGIDTRSMRAKRDAQRQRESETVAAERARLKREEEEILSSFANDEADALPPRVAPTSHDESAPPPQQVSEPSPLVERLHIENLRSFAGAHDITLAPITLIYGPNSAGKSTVIKALRLLMQVVDSGRFDALRPWDAAFSESSARSLMTYAEPDPDDPSGYQWRSPLALGVDFKAQDGRRAHARLEYDLNPVGSIDVHTTSFGPLDAGPMIRKRFTPENFDDDHDPFHPADFGESHLATFIVEEGEEGEAWSRETKLVDAELFGHADRKLQAELFEMAFLLRYLGPHRGAPGKAYDPVSGAFNSGWFDGYRKPRRPGFSEFDLLNQMLAQLEIPYEFEEDPLWKLRNPHQQKWTLKDARSGAPVDLNQVGYGVSQLLPVIDVCVHAERQIIGIEEPELHLHPRLQARLGNLFATAAVMGRNQVIVETHSEAILLRLRRLIRGGKLRPDAVAVIYVDNTAAEGASVRRLRLGDRGELLDPWPTGFFDDGLADILGITS